MGPSCFCGAVRTVAGLTLPADGPPATGGSRLSISPWSGIPRAGQLGNLKTAITGTYHAFAFAKYAHRYLAEFQFRFNRRFNMRTILHRLLRSMLQAPPAPEHAIRLAEACG